MTQRVDKDSLPLNQPRRTPGHPDKSHIVKTKVDGKEKIIRFGEQGASTAGKPKEGESDRVKAKRASFKSRHAKNIAKGPSSPAYWANKVKWADGGSVRLNYAQGDSVRVTPQNAALGSIANFLKQSYAPQRTQQMQGVMEFLGVPAVARTVERMSYGQPITNLNKANVPLLPEDTAEAAMIVAPPLASMAKRVGTNLVQTAPYVARDIAQSMSSPLKSYVVKPKGGNWIAGGIEEGLKSIKKSGGLTPQDISETEAHFQSILPKYDLNDPRQSREISDMRNHLEAMKRAHKVDNWVDTKLYKYIKNEMATPEDSLRIQADDFATEKAEMLAVKDAQLTKARADMEAARQARGFTPEMMTSSQARIRELENERGLLAERTGLHVVPEPFGPLTREDVWNIREMEGFPGQGMGTSDVARRWETAADMEAGLDTASAYKHALEQNPWLAKVDPNSPVYDFGSRGSRNMGFDHMVDELRNALDPASGLPEKLLIKLEDLDKMTVPRAAKLVDQINAWRAMQQVEANAARAGNAATQVFKEYPEQGVNWVELKLPKPLDVLPEGWSEPVAKGNTLQTKSPDGKIVLGDSIPELVKNIYRRHPDTPGNPEKVLEDALKYEGEIMQHCVGGYCPDVIEGRSRIFSLRDQKGQPYATVETKPNRIQDFTARTPDPDNPAQTLRDRINAERSGNGDFESYGFDLLQRLGIEPPMDIVQIKGPKNRAPDAKYLPMIQDFVKSGNWNKVDDLQNTGLYSVDPGSDLALKLKAAGRELPRYINDEDLTRLTQEFPPEGYMSGGAVRGYAEGGSVSAYDPMQVDDVMNSINAPRGYEEGGRVQGPDIEFSEDPEALRLYNYAMKQATINPGESASGVGAGMRARLGGGDFSAGFDMNRMTQGERDQMMRSLATGYNINLGDLNLDARVQKPLEAQDVYIGMLNGSIPLKTGRAMLGVQGIKTPQGSDVLGYNVGWSGKAGPGRLSANLNKPKRGNPSAQVQYQIPFAEGGSVTAYDSGRVDAILNQFM